MLTIGIETSLSTGLVFLSKGEEILSSHKVPSHSSSKYLVSIVASILKKANLSINKIDGLIVSKGPGSFTGLRIGISFAKSLSFCLKLPLAGISSLDCIAFCVPFSGIVCSLIPAYRQSFFSAFFYKKGEIIEKVNDYLFLPLEGIMDKAKKFFPEKVVFVFPPEYMPFSVKLEPGLSLFKGKISLDKALLKLGLRSLESGKTVDPLLLKPIYVSAPLINKRGK